MPQPSAEWCVIGAPISDLPCPWASRDEPLSTNSDYRTFDLAFTGDVGATQRPAEPGTQCHTPYVLRRWQSRVTT